MKGEENRKGRKKEKEKVSLLNYGMIGDQREVSEKVLNYWHVNHSKRN